MASTTETYMVLLFGPAADVVGAHDIRIEIDHPAPTVDVLERHVVRSHPELRELVEAGRLAVNTRIARRDSLVSPDDEIALISMVSGG